MYVVLQASLVAQLIKNLPAMQEMPGLLHGSGRSPGERIGYPSQFSWAFQVAQIVKYLPAVRRPGFDPSVGKIPWGRAWKPTPILLPGESPWTEEPGGLQSVVSQRAGHD